MNERFAGSLVERTSDEFNRDGDEAVSPDAGVYATVALAEAASDAYDALFDACGSQLEQLIDPGLRIRRGLDDRDARECASRASCWPVNPSSGPSGRMNPHRKVIA